MANLTNEEFLERLNKNKNGRFIALEDYTSHKTPMKFRHICGHEFTAAPNTILNKRSEGCPLCGARNRVLHRTKQISTLIDEVNSLYPDGRFYVYPDQIIINNKTKIKVKCTKCKNDFMISPSNLLRDRGCPMCCKTIANQSKNSDRIRDYLLNSGYALRSIIDSTCEKYFIKEKSFDGLLGIGSKPLRFDYAIYNKDKLILLLEYDGEYHYRNVNENKLMKVQSNDSIKNDYCQKNNIKLVRICYKNFKLSSYMNMLDDIFKDVLEFNE